jgi:hypothetical protein
MADINVEKRGARPNFAWGWLGLGILLLAVLAWIIYSFVAMGTGPEPPPVDFERVSPGQTAPQTAPGTAAPGTTAPGATTTPQTAPGTTAPGTTTPGTTTPPNP